MNITLTALSQHGVAVEMKLEIGNEIFLQRGCKYCWCRWKEELAIEITMQWSKEEEEESPGFHDTHIC